jgi:hypothetical protein
VDLYPFCRLHVYVRSGIIKLASLVRRKVYAVRSTTGMIWSSVAASIPCVTMLAVPRKLFLVKKVEVGDHDAEDVMVPSLMGKHGGLC